MYVDYRIINEKEVVAINEEVESVKITGPNTGDIKKAMLLYNEIDGMKMNIIIQNKAMEDLNDEIAETKETRNKERVLYQCQDIQNLLISNTKRSVTMLLKVRSLL